MMYPKAFEHEIGKSEVLKVPHSLDSFSFCSRWNCSTWKNAYMHSTLSLSSLPKVALGMVPVFIWLNTDCSWSLRVECQLLPLPTLLSFWWSVLWCFGLSMFRKFLKHLSTSALPSCILLPDVMSAVFACLSAHSFPLALAILACQG